MMDLTEKAIAGKLVLVAEDGSEYRLSVDPQIKQIAIRIDDRVFTRRFRRGWPKLTKRFVEKVTGKKVVFRDKEESCE